LAETPSVLPLWRHQWLPPSINPKFTSPLRRFDKENRDVPLQWRPITDTSKRPKGAQKPHPGGLNREELGWITCVAWKNNKKKREKEDKGSMHRSQGSTYRSQIKHGTHVIGPGWWSLHVNLQDSSKRREWPIQRLWGRKMMYCSSHASATAACKQSRPKQGEGKDQASDT